MEILLLVHIILIHCLTKAPAVVASIARPGCQDRCGDVAIPYPFGIGRGCYMNEGFSVTCNFSSGALKPFLSSVHMELLGVSVTGQVQVRNPVITSNCTTNSSALGIDLSGSPFVYSSTYNRFTALGCDNYATISQRSSVIGGCLSICSGTTSGTGCYGLNCCQTTIPPDIKSFVVTMETVFNRGVYNRQQPCSYAFMVDQNWSNSKQDRLDVVQKGYVQAVLQWGTHQGPCDIDSESDIFCTASGYCWASLGNTRYLCVCASSYNQLGSLTYVSESAGCQEGQCMVYRNCWGYCVHTSNSYNCSCPSGYRPTTDNGCVLRFPVEALNKKPRTKIILIGCGSGVGLLLVLIGVWWLYNTIKRWKAIKLKQKFFKRNGGLLLQQQLSPNENNVEQTKLFTSRELEKATDHYSVNRMLGQGGQGTVYKGMLTDGRIVAVKKSKVVDEDKLDQFINEVVILSQINHRNVVKLLGCCLETEVPLLVYEFISNGTLSQAISDQKEEFPMTWEMRLRIASEAADALSYLHSAASMPIYHRDVKSTNILLDDKYRAKVSDFGTSKSISVEQTHVTTRVQGTFGYLDPEYFQSSQFTEKSDVYSFGVVLVELLTGRKPISSTRSAEGRSLTSYFLLAMEKDRLFEILDSRVLKEGGKDKILGLAKLARRCLNLNGKKRPTMKAVAMELERIKELQGASSAIIEQECEEFDYTVSDVAAPWEDFASSSTGSGLNS